MLVHRKSRKNKPMNDVFHEEDKQWKGLSITKKRMELVKGARSLASAYFQTAMKSLMEYYQGEYGMKEETYRDIAETLIKDQEFIDKVFKALLQDMDSLARNVRAVDLPLLAKNENLVYEGANKYETASRGRRKRAAIE